MAKAALSTKKFKKMQGETNDRLDPLIVDHQRTNERLDVLIERQQRTNELVEQLVNAARFPARPAASE
jgi:hypothetical protein